MKISDAITKFFELKLKTKSKMFHMEDMYAFVTAKVGVVSPGSPDRIMRSMRRDNEIGYLLLDRADSSYVVTGVA